MEQIIKNLKSLDKSFFNDDKNEKMSLLSKPVYLTTTSRVVPEKKKIKFRLPHRNVDSICLIVGDENKTNTKQIEHLWKLKWATCEDVPDFNPTVTFISLKELSTCYQTFDSKRKLASTFDIFLVDNRIYHRIANKLGKHFFSSPSKYPLKVNLNGKNMKLATKEALETGYILSSGFGTSDSHYVGENDMKMEEIIENIKAVAETLCEKWPGGGISNINGIYLQFAKKSVPIYYSSPLKSKDSCDKKLLISNIVNITEKGIKRIKYKNNKKADVTKGKTLKMLKKISSDPETNMKINRLRKLDLNETGTKRTDLLAKKLLSKVSKDIPMVA